MVRTITRPDRTVEWLPAPVPNPLGNPDLGSDNWSPEVSLTWTATESLTVFANLKQAYKSGSFDLTTAKPGEDSSFKDVKVVRRRTRRPPRSMASTWMSPMCRLRSRG